MKTIYLLLITALFIPSAYASNSSPKIVSSAGAWDSMNTANKVDIVTETIKIFGQQGIVIRKEPEFYVDEIENVRATSLEMRLEKVGVILKTVAIMYRDFDNGKSPDALVQKALSKEDFEDYISGNRKEEYEQIYLNWLKERSP